MSVRVSLFRPNRGSRRVAIKDVCTAFLQSDKYPDGVVKYVCFKDPLTLQWEYFKQSGPIYGEASAVIRWEDTIAPWYESQGFTRGENEPCAFLQEVRDVLSLLWTDDNMIDGEEDDIQWTSDLLDERFKCQATEWLVVGTDVDYLGMEVFLDSLYIGLCMQKYITKTLVLLDLSDIAIKDTPMTEPIDTDSEPLVGSMITLFMTAVGCLGWLVNTCRPDVAYAHSRIAQHNSKPNASAWKAVRHCFAYLKGTADWCIRSPLNADDRPLSDFGIPNVSHGWEFFCDSDFAGNCEV